jgi:hypothetical protein
MTHNEGKPFSGRQAAEGGTLRLEYLEPVDDKNRLGRTGRYPVKEITPEMPSRTGI